MAFCQHESHGAYSIMGSENTMMSQISQTQTDRQDDSTYTPYQNSQTQCNRKGRVEPKARGVGNEHARV